MTAIGALVSVILFLAGLIGYLWKELRAESRARAKDSTLFLHTLETSRLKYSGRARALHPDDQITPSDPPRPVLASPQTLQHFYSQISPRTNPTRK